MGFMTTATFSGASTKHDDNLTLITLLQLQCGDN